MIKTLTKLVVDMSVDERTCCRTLATRDLGLQGPMLAKLFFPAKFFFDVKKSWEQKNDPNDFTIVGVPWYRQQVFIVDAEQMRLVHVGRCNKSNTKVPFGVDRKLIWKKVNRQIDMPLTPGPNSTNLQLHTRQRCGRIERFHVREKLFLYKTRYAFNRKFGSRSTNM
jgi:hypothetical protein